MIKTLFVNFECGGLLKYIYNSDKTQIKNRITMPINMATKNSLFIILVYLISVTYDLKLDFFLI